MLPDPIDARPLCLYGLNSEQFSALGDTLRRRLRYADPARLSDEAAAGFCLFASEWWRRNHTGGHWKWEGIQAALHIEDLSQNHLREWTGKGLRYLQRPLLQNAAGRQYLDTLATEAGFPIPLIRDQESALHDALRGLLHKLDEEADAEQVPSEQSISHMASVSATFPPRLRHAPVFHITGRFLAAVWPFIQQASSQDEPEQWLEAHESAWRKVVPFEVGDDVLHAFVRRVLDEGTRIRRKARPLRILTTIHQKDAETWILVRQLEAPPKLTLAEAEARFGDQTHDAVIQLHLVGHRRTLAGVYRRQGENLYYEDLNGRSLNHPDELRVLCTSMSGSRVLDDVQDAQSLGELPWVFAQQRDVWRWTQAGSPSAGPRMLALGAGASIRAGDPTRRGTLGFDGRSLWYAPTQVTVSTEFGDIEIPCEQATDVVFAWRGNRVQGLKSRHSMFAGWPKLIAMGSGLQNERSYQVRTHGQWLPPTGQFGRVSVRHLGGRGRPLLAERLTVLPIDLELELHQVGPANGELTLRSRRLQAVRVVGQPGLQVEVRRDGDTHHVNVRALAGLPPSELRLQLQLPQTTVDVSTATPIRFRGFFDADGVALPIGASVHIGELHGIEARLVDVGEGSHHYLELEASHHTRLVPLQAEGRTHRLDLGALQERLRALLGQSSELDAKVTVRLYSPGTVVPVARRPCVEVRRYDWKPIPNKVEEHVLLPDAADAETVQVQARSFSDIREVETLERIPGTLSWSFPTAGRRPGAWLITASHEGWHRARPLLWTIEGGVEAEGLVGAAHLADPDQRQQAFHRVLETLANDLDHLDWVVLDDFLEASRALPSATFDLLHALVEHPVVCLAALRLSWLEPRSRAETLEKLSALPFCWHAIPVEFWRRALQGFFDSEEACEPGTGFDQLLKAVQDLAQTIDLIELVQAVPMAPDGRSFMNQGSCRGEIRRLTSDLFTRHREEQQWPALELPRPDADLQLIHERRQEPPIDMLVQAPAVAVSASRSSRMPTSSLARELRAAHDYDPIYFRAAWKALMNFNLGVR